MYGYRPKNRMKRASWTPCENLGRHCGVGYATAGYSPGQRPDGNVSQRYCPASAVLRGGERAHQHPPAAGGGHCGGNGQGCEVWQTAQALAGELSQCLPAVESRSDHRHSGSKGVWDAAVHFPLPGRDLRKGQVVVRGLFYKNVYFFVNRPCFLDKVRIPYKSHSFNTLTRIFKSPNPFTGTYTLQSGKEWWQI